jgi:hypothetical protein
VNSFVPSPKVPVHIFHLGNIVNHVFEDLRKTKAPNTMISIMLLLTLTNEHDENVYDTKMLFWI